MKEADRFATFDALTDPQSSKSRKVAAFLKERMLIKLRHLNVPGLEDIEIRLHVSESGRNDHALVEVEAFRQDALVGRASDDVAIILPAPSQKEINTRIHGKLIYALCDEIRRSRYDDAPLVMDAIFYDHLRQWLTPAQILEFANQVHSGKYAIHTIPGVPKEIAQMRVDTRAYCLSARFSLGQGVWYDHATVYVDGAMPKTLALALENRPIHSVVECRLFEGRGDIKIVSVQKAQLRMVIERSIISLDEIKKEAATCTAPKNHFISPIAGTRKLDG